MRPISLSMLWEKSADPVDALRDRFGFDGAGSAGRWLVETVATTWAMEQVECDWIVISDTSALAWLTTAQGEFVAKWTCAQEKFQRFAFACDLLRSLDASGMAVPAPAETVDGGRSVVVRPREVPLALTVLARLPGNPLDPTDPGRVFGVGTMLAKLHQVMATYRASRPEGIEARDLDLHRRITTWLDTQDAGLVPDASARLRRRLSELKPLEATPQLLHGDFRAANILTQDGHVTGVLDFDELAWDYRIWEVAHACVYLSTLFTTWRPTPAVIRQRFLDGYLAVNPLRPAEREWLEALILQSGIGAVPAGPDPDGWAAAI